MRVLMRILFSLYSSVRTDENENRIEENKRTRKPNLQNDIRLVGEVHSDVNGHWEN